MPMIPEKTWEQSRIKVDEARVVHLDENALSVNFVIDDPKYVDRFRRLMDKISVTEYPTFADHLGLIFTMAALEINSEG